jgi:hypothetical protein
MRCQWLAKMRCQWLANEVHEALCEARVIIGDALCEVGVIISGEQFDRLAYSGAS